jgi:hypothetical protein
MRAVPTSDAMTAFSSRDGRTLPPRIALPPLPSQYKEADVDKFRGFRRPLRYLVIDTLVARPAVNGPHSVQFRPICS